MLQKEVWERYMPKNTPLVNDFLQQNPTFSFLLLHSNSLTTRIRQGINPLTLEIS